MDQQALHRTLMRFARHLATGYAAPDVLYELCDAATDILDVSGAGVMLSDHEGHLRFVAASDEAIREIERLQIELDEGPCLRSARTGAVVAVPDLAGDHGFRRFAPAALERGLQAVFSFPMAIDDAHVGAFNLYRSQNGQKAPPDTQTGALLAQMATAYLVNARTREAAARTVAQLQEALDSRVVIEQAKGTLAERRGWDLDEAFHRLRTHARSTQQRLHAVAEAVVEGRLDL